MNEPVTEQAVQQQIVKLADLRASIARVIVGQDEVVEQLLIGLLAGGHCLLEGVPGLGKTLLVRSLGEALHLEFRRIQFTPDLMPSDILGTEILEEDHGTGKRYFKFQKGPVFTSLLLADELNRTPPKTQAALLEAMQEHTISYAGTTYPLPEPFFVLATQNPLEQAGTYPLPEAQLDRFLLHIRVGYPSEAEERAILDRTTGSGMGKANAVMDGEEVIALQKLVREVHVSEGLLAAEGIEAEVIDLRTIRPMDLATVIESVKKTNRCVAVEEGYPQFSVTSEIAAQVMTHAFDYLDAPVARVAGKDVPMPYAANLEKLALPNADEVVAAVKGVLYV